MSLAAILYPSPTEHGWTEWTFQNLNHHLAIDTAIQQARGVQVTVFRLWPVPHDGFRDWLEQHQQSHNLFNSVLGISGQDLTGLDLKDKETRDAWFFQHYIQHQAAAQTLGLPTL